MNLYQIHVAILRKIRFRLSRKHAMICVMIRRRRVNLESAKDLIPLRHDVYRRIVDISKQIEEAKSTRLDVIF